MTRTRNGKKKAPLIWINRDDFSRETPRLSPLSSIHYSTVYKPYSVECTVQYCTLEDVFIQMYLRYSAIGGYFPDKKSRHSYAHSIENGTVQKHASIYAKSLSLDTGVQGM